jgi:membrane-associated protein
MIDTLVGLVLQSLDFFKHLPDYLHIWALDYGTGIYLILFLIIFCETGLVVTPLLPGDSLLFAAGATLTLNLPGLDLPAMCLVLTIAAVFGNMVNYHFGKFIGPKIFGKKVRWLNRKHLERTEEFFRKHGGKTIILTRFMPIVRTYAPFVAGLSRMNYSQFFIFNLIGGASWVCSFLILGYYFGTIPVIKSNFQYVVLGIIVVSFAPVAVEFWKSRAKRKAA